MECPSKEELEEFALERQKTDLEESLISRHIRECEKCQSEVFFSEALYKYSGQVEKNIPDLRLVIGNAIKKSASPSPPRSFFSLPRKISFVFLVFVIFWAGFLFYRKPDSSSQPIQKASFSKVSSPIFHVFLEKQGEVFITDVNGKKSAGDVGGKISVGDRINTGPDGQAWIASEEGNQIRLKENSTAQVQTSNSWKVEEGLVGFNIKPSGKAGFEVVTPYADVRVIGTIFVVKVNSILSRIALLKGQIEVSSSGKISKYLVSKQEVSASNSEISELYPATDELYFAWYWEKASSSSILASPPIRIPGSYYPGLKRN